MAEKFNYGGQALIEGVMMRGPHHMTAAVRHPDGHIEFMEEELNSPLYNGWVSKVPFVRGLGLLWDSLGLGMRALMWSANIQLEAEEAETGEAQRIEGGEAAGTIAFSVALAVGLFFLLPAAAAGGIGSLFGIESALVDNLIEGVIRLGIVIGYIALIGLMPDVKTLWRYHGAEHKTINAYEAGARLTPEEVKNYPLEHPRCGTGFLLVVVLFSVLLGILLGDLPLGWRLLSRVALIPVIAGIAYEYIKLLARNMGSPIVRVLVYPQLAMQQLTTAEPSEKMIEVAIHALRRVLAAEGLESDPEPAPQEAA